MGWGCQLLLAEAPLPLPFLSSLAPRVWESAFAPRLFLVCTFLETVGSLPSNTGALERQPESHTLPHLQLGILFWTSKHLAALSVQAEGFGCQACSNEAKAKEQSHTYLLRGKSESILWDFCPSKWFHLFHLFEAGLLRK